MPSGRDVHTILAFDKPCLDEHTLFQLRAPPEKSPGEGVAQNVDSSDDEDGGRPSDSGLPGTFPAGSGQSTEPYY